MNRFLVDLLCFIPYFYSTFVKRVHDRLLNLILFTLINWIKECFWDRL